jgi:hypothetical protein
VSLPNWGPKCAAKRAKRAARLRRRYGHATGADAKWVIVEPLVKAQVMGGAYIKSPDGRFVIFARRYRKGDRGFRHYVVWYTTVEYIDGCTYKTGGANKTLYDGSSINQAKAAMP